MCYDKMSDFEINKKVLEIKSGMRPIGYAHHADKRSAAIVDVNNKHHWYDFCNSWEDAGPIIQKNRIHLNPLGVSDWCATTECDSFEQINNNPLRAAMIVFLMVQEEV